MLTRRQLRIKVMQALFAFQNQDESEMRDLEKFLNNSMAQTYTLYLYMLQLLVELHKLAEYRLEKQMTRHLATPEDLNPSRNFVENRILCKLAASQELKDSLEKRKLKPWDLNDKYIKNLFDRICESKAYVVYMSEPETSLKKDLSFLIQIYSDIIVPSDEIMDFLEDENLTWMDDYPLVNTAMIMFLRKVKPSKEVRLPSLFKDESDAKFTMDLFRKSLLNQDEYQQRIEGKTPNWEKDRIAQLDLILIQMAQAEFLNFSSIPVKVTMNEYLEISKDYSTPKSSFFINGILDNLVKEFEKEGVLNKMGRGLM